MTEDLKGSKDLLENKLQSQVIEVQSNQSNKDQETSESPNKSKKVKENAREEKKEEDEQIYLCHCSFSTEEDCKLTREKIEQFLKSDDVEIPKETIIKYRLKKDNENENEQNFKELKEPFEDLKLISKSQLELELEIDIDSYLEEL